jgi:hypothetical protein
LYDESSCFKDAHRGPRAAPPAVGLTEKNSMNLLIAAALGIGGYLLYEKYVKPVASAAASAALSAAGSCSATTQLIPGHSYKYAVDGGTSGATLFTANTIAAIESAMTATGKWADVSAWLRSDPSAPSFAYPASTSPNSILIMATYTGAASPVAPAPIMVGTVDCGAYTELPGAGGGSAGGISATFTPSSPLASSATSSAPVMATATATVPVDMSQASQATAAPVDTSQPSSAPVYYSQPTSNPVYTAQPSTAPDYTTQLPPPPAYAVQTQQAVSTLSPFARIGSAPSTGPSSSNAKHIHTGAQTATFSLADAHDALELTMLVQAMLHAGGDPTAVAKLQTLIDSPTTSQAHAVIYALATRGDAKAQQAAQLLTSYLAHRAAVASKSSRATLSANLH